MSKLSLISWALSLSQGKALSWWPKRNPKTHYSSHPVHKKKSTNLKTLYVLLLTQAERAAECPISKWKLLSISSKPAFWKKYHHSFIHSHSPLWTIFGSRGSGNWNPFTHLSGWLGMGARKTIPLLNRSIQTKKAEMILLLRISMKATENNSVFLLSSQQLKSDKSDFENFFCVFCFKQQIIMLSMVCSLIVISYLFDLCYIAEIPEEVHHVKACTKKVILHFLLERSKRICWGWHSPKALMKAIRETLGFVTATFCKSELSAWRGVDCL